MIKNIVFLGLLLGFATFSAHAQIYKWVDEKGKVHYSDVPVSSPKLEHKRINPEQNNLGGCDSNCMAKIDDPECSFIHYTRDGDYGKKLAYDAKAECLTNKRNRNKPGFVASTEARDRHFQYLSQARKENAEHRARAVEQGQREMERIQRRAEERDRQEKLDNISRRQDEILRQQDQMRQQQDEMQRRQQWEGNRSYDCQRSGTNRMDCTPR